MCDCQDGRSNAHDHPKCAITRARAEMHDHTGFHGALRNAAGRDARRASPAASRESIAGLNAQIASRERRAIFTTRRLDIRRARGDA